MFKMLQHFFQLRFIMFSLLQSNIQMTYSIRTSRKKNYKKQNIHHKLSYYFIFLNILSIHISSVTLFLDFHINVAFPTIYSSGKGPQ